MVLFKIAWRLVLVAFGLFAAILGVGLPLCTFLVLVLVWSWPSRWRL